MFFGGKQAFSGKTAGVFRKNAPFQPCFAGKARLFLRRKPGGGDASVTFRRTGKERRFRANLPRSHRIPVENRVQASIGGGGSTPVRRCSGQCAGYEHASSKPQDSCGNLRRRQRTNGAAVQKCCAEVNVSVYEETLLATTGFLRKSAVETSIGGGDSTPVRRRRQCAVSTQIYQEAFLTPGISPL